MKDLAWSHIYSVGCKEIDDDHRKLVNLFNLLNHAVQQGETTAYVAATLQELINCTVWHFSHEERLMLKHRYPEAAAHTSEHRDLIEGARELQQAILQADKPMAEDHIRFLERWLTEHILTADMRLGAYLSEML
jgi:hemerythrin